LPVWYAARPMDALRAILLGVVEGVTEYLPVSSTGHLILASYLFGLAGAGLEAFEIVIQLGAILAVLVHYRRLLGERAGGLLRGDPRARRLVVALAAAFVPTAVAGLLLRSAIKKHLFGPVPVVAALVAGGILMIVVEAVRSKKKVEGLTGLEHVDARRAVLIGLGQCVSLWPGSSRSMCTIVAGQLTGLSTATAAEFSFLLALPTLGAATIYEAYKSRHDLAAMGPSNVALGLAVSFLIAWAVIAVFLRYLQRHGLAPFGFYRVAVGVLMLLWLGQ
jgi:undecaprenyl-diphosphatase